MLIELGRKCGLIFVSGKEKQAEPQLKKTEAEKAAKIAVLDSQDGRPCGLILQGPWAGICGFAFIFLCFILCYVLCQCNVDFYFVNVN